MWRRDPQRTLACVLSAFLLSGAAMAAEQPAPLPKPLSANVASESLILTDDVATAEAQAQSYPNNPEAHYLLAIAYSRTPYLEKAYQAFRKAKKLMKKSEAGYAGINDKIAEYEAMLAYRPEDPLVLYRLAFGYYTKGYGIEHDYIQNTPETPQSYYEKAETTLRRLIAVDPQDVWARNYLGFLLVDIDEKKHLDEAIRLWEESLAVKKDNPGAYMLLGEAYMRKGNLRKAVEYGAQGLHSRLSWQTD